MVETMPPPSGRSPHRSLRQPRLEFAGPIAAVNQVGMAVDEARVIHRPSQATMLGASSARRGRAAPA